MYNILFTNAGRRATLLKDFQKSLGKSAKIIATDNWCVAPALFVADKYYLSPKIQDPNYITFLLEICKKEKVNAVTSLIDPEIMLLAKNRQIFIENGILPLVPDKETAEICFDKYKMYEYLTQKGIKTVQSYKSMEQFEKALQHGDLHFPVFIKPRTGSGSVGPQNLKQLHIFLINSNNISSLNDIVLLAPPIRVSIFFFENADTTCPEIASI